MWWRSRGDGDPGDAHRDLEVRRRRRGGAAGGGAARYLGLASMARAVNMALAIPMWRGRTSGVGLGHAACDSRDGPADGRLRVRPGDAMAEGGGRWLIALRLALPRIKMVLARDFIWKKDAGAHGSRCPARWARAWSTGRSSSGRWRDEVHGPVSMPVDYQPEGRNRRPSDTMSSSFASRSRRHMA